MNCSYTHILISPYIDGELQEQDMRRLENHMKVCSKCRAEFEESKELHNLFANVDRLKTPYGFHTRVMANISLGKTKARSRIPVFAGLAEGFAIMAVIVLGIFSGTQLTRGFMPDKAKEVVVSFSLDVFDPAPPGSLGGVYLAMTEVRNEK